MNCSKADKKGSFAQVSGLKRMKNAQVLCLIYMNRCEKRAYFSSVPKTMTKDKPYTARDKRSLYQKTCTYLLQQYL